MPRKPKMIERTLILVILSFKKIVAKIITQIGTVNSIAVTSESDRYIIPRIQPYWPKRWKIFL
jgi:hypothetical protein